jgi:chromosome segregation protein
VQAQSGLVNVVQQQIQVLAAEQRGMQAQARQLEQRQARLQADQQALALPEDQHLHQLQTQLTEAKDRSAQTQAQLQSLEDMAAEVETNRRQAQEVSNQQSAKLVELQARQEALKALQEKLRTDERLTPWLKKHGLENLQPLWNKLSITPGWEQALEAALRERLTALEVSRIDSVKAFAADVPMAKLSFYTPGMATSSAPKHKLPRLFDQLKLNDAGMSGLLADWLTGCFTASSLDEAMAARSQLQAGEQIFIAQGHSVGLHNVNFYAQDSEQSGMLARAQEIENLDKQIRAQSLMSEEARMHLVRADSAAAQSAQARTQKRVEATDTQAQAHALNVEFLRLQQQAEQTRARQGQLENEVGDLQTEMCTMRACDNIHTL